MAPFRLSENQHYTNAQRSLRDSHVFRSNWTAHELGDEEAHAYSQIVTIVTMVVILFVTLGCFFFCILQDCQSRNEDDAWPPASDGYTVASNQDGICQSCREAAEKQQQGLQDHIVGMSVSI